MAVVTRLLVSIGALALLLTLHASAASAHTELLDSDPEDGANLDAAPGQIVLTFGEPPFDQGLAVVAVGPDGSKTSLNPQVEGAKVIVPWPPVASVGDYQVNWRVVAADGHPLSGTLRFSIRPTASATKATRPTQPAATATPETTTAPSAVSNTAGSQNSFPTWVLILIGVLVLVGVRVAIRRMRRRPNT
jgi:methionine-rich copper-binding protein CopC